MMRNRRMLELGSFLLTAVTGCSDSSGPKGNKNTPAAVETAGASAPENAKVSAAPQDQANSVPVAQPIVTATPTTKVSPPTKLKPPTDVHALVCSVRTFRDGATCVPSAPMYHWSNATSGGQFYTPGAGPECAGKTSTAKECSGEAVNEGGWAYVGVAFYSIYESTSAAVVAAAVPWYRYRRLDFNHFYTKDVAETMPYAGSGDMILEGFYRTFPAGVPLTVPLYRWHNPTKGRHYWTTRAGKECLGKTTGTPECGGQRINEDGWTTFEGIATYVFP